MKAVPLIAALAGLAVMAALIAAFGAGAVFRSLVSIGWQGFAVICLIQLALIAVMGLAWRGLVPEAQTLPFLWARLVRDAGSEVLPLSPVGGCVLGARALSLSGVSASTAAASTIVDLTVEFFAKLAYTALGLALLISLRPSSEIALPLAGGLAATGLVAAGFVMAQHRGFGLFDRLAGILGRGWAERIATGSAALHAALLRTYQARLRLWVGFFLHLGCWIAGALEAWIALRLAGAPLPFKTVLVIESLLYAVRTFAFAIPNAVGVQEGAYILIGTNFGLAPEMALALSLLKRARDLTIGLPALGAWQIVEFTRLWRGRRMTVRGSGPPAAIIDRREP